MKKKTVVHLLVNIEGYIATLMMIVLTLLLFVQVVSRYVFKYSFSWTEELSLILFVWAVYLGVAAAITSGRQMRIDLLIRALPPLMRKVLLIFSNIVFLLFCLLMLKPILNVIANLGASTTVFLRIPNKLAYSAIPVALLLSTIRLVADGIKIVKMENSKVGVQEATIDLGELAPGEEPLKDTKGERT